MIFQEATSGAELILLAATFLTLTGFWRLLKRGAVAELVPVEDDHTESAHSNSSALIAPLETSAAEDADTIETRIRTRMAMLDRIAWEADQEIERLQGLLGEVHRANRAPRGQLTESSYRTATQPSIESIIGPKTTRNPSGEITVSERRTIINLDRAGFMAHEIAEYMDLPQDKVAALLADNEGRTVEPAPSTQR